MGTIAAIIAATATLVTAVAALIRTVRGHSKRLTTLENGTEKKEG